MSPARLSQPADPAAFRDVAHGAGFGVASKIVRVCEGSVPGWRGMEWLKRLWTHPDRASEVTVQRGEARLEDREALDRLLAPLPEAHGLRARLTAPFFARAWDAGAELDHWIASDGERVACYTIRGLTLRQAAEVRVRWDALHGRDELTEDRLADIVARRTGKLVTLVS